MLRGPGSCVQKLCKRKQFCEQFKFKKLVSSNPWLAVAAITNNFTSRAQNAREMRHGGRRGQTIESILRELWEFHRVERRDVVNPRRRQSSPPQAQGQGVISTTKRRIFYCQCRYVVIISVEICEQNSYHSHHRWPCRGDGAVFTLSFGSHYHIAADTCHVSDSWLLDTCHILHLVQCQHKSVSVFVRSNLLSGTLTCLWHNAAPGTLRKSFQETHQPIKHVWLHFKGLNPLERWHRHHIFQWLVFIPTLVNWKSNFSGRCHIPPPDPDIIVRNVPRPSNAASPANYHYSQL